MDHHGPHNDVREEEDPEKGEGQIDEVISFKVRLNIGRDLDIEMKQNSTIKQLKENISSQLNDLDPSRIRIIAKGKMYQDSYLLSSPFAIHNGDLIQVCTQKIQQ